MKKFVVSGGEGSSGGFPVGRLVDDIESSFLALFSVSGV